MASKIACSPLTGRIYQGRANPKTGMWVGQKKDVTSDVLESIIAKAEFHGGVFDIEGGGREWVVTVKEVT